VLKKKLSGSPELSIKHREVGSEMAGIMRVSLHTIRDEFTPEE